MYSTVVAYFTTIAKPFPILRKLLAIISGMNNHPYLMILNQKIITNTKSSMLLTLMQYQINCKTNATVVILSHKKIVKPDMGL